MAFGAYAQLDTVDADARYHAAVLHCRSGDAAAALALADTILAESPGHLFGYIVRGQRGCSSGTTPPAWPGRGSDFLAHYHGRDRRATGPSTPSTSRSSTNSNAKRNGHHP